MGLLRVKDTIDIRQFWPSGTSDADTVKVKVNATAGTFAYRSDSSSSFKKTRVFDKSVVFSPQGRKPPIDKKGYITVRLQGIDAPELHYRPANLTKSNHVTDDKRAAYKNLNHEYRQHFGETATVKLRELLSTVKKQLVPCEVITRVEQPTDVFDVYARFIGDIIVSIKGKPVNINHWLVANGWALPAFYVSMTPEEINTLLQIYQKAKKGKTRTVGNYQSRVNAFDASLVMRPVGSAIK